MINSWYFLWVLPFAVIYPSFWAWGASFALMLSYATGFNLDDVNLELFEIPLWVQWLEYSSIALLAAFDLWLYRKFKMGLKSTRDAPASPAS